MCLHQAGPFRNPWYPAFLHAELSAPRETTEEHSLMQTRDQLCFPRDGLFVQMLAFFRAVSTWRWTEAQLTSAKAHHLILIVTRSLMYNWSLAHDNSGTNNYSSKGQSPASTPESRNQFRWNGKATAQGGGHLESNHFPQPWGKASALLCSSAPHISQLSTLTSQCSREPHVALNWKAFLSFAHQSCKRKEANKQKTCCCCKLTLGYVSVLTQGAVRDLIQGKTYPQGGFNPR